ncbi:hypothetical protein EJ03DRAFT_213944 [Teratosphaeria nubilosa]|uniref:Uncharacterized protein n=1 Tax=Teratosphaeria nubilosa TaxID=161662 RepID=A0A6G1LHP5_9PEZI|nr:hypothetical protein EJ03DRAFT_213944 [Teratosphaeria nubilosa]
MSLEVVTSPYIALLTSVRSHPWPIVECGSGSDGGSCPTNGRVIQLLTGSQIIPSRLHVSIHHRPIPIQMRPSQSTTTAALSSPLPFSQPLLPQTKLFLTSVRPDAGRSDRKVFGHPSFVIQESWLSITLFV